MNAEMIAMMFAELQEQASAYRALRAQEAELRGRTYAAKLCVNTLKLRLARLKKQHGKPAAEGED